MATTSSSGTRGGRTSARKSASGSARRGSRSGAADTAGGHGVLDDTVVTALFDEHAAPMSGTRSTQIGAPPLWKVLLEQRAFVERAQFTLTGPFQRCLPEGDGHGVLVLPGFTSSDRATQPMRRALRRAGHRTYAWRLGTNLGPTQEVLDGLVHRVEHIVDRTGGPISIVGWSLGGIYARELARSMSDHVRCVVTMGSPIQMADGDRSSAQLVWNRLSSLHSPDFRLDERDAHRPRLTVPATSIYSRTDGVVNWQASLIRRSEISETIRVYGSHMGLGFNPSAIYAVADRLSQPAGEWQHFKAPWWARSAYPRAIALDVDRLPVKAA